MFSPNTITPIIIAVTGSKGDRSAVIVEPIDFIANIRVRFAIIVEKTAINNISTPDAIEGIGLRLPLIRLKPRQINIATVIT